MPLKTQLVSVVVNCYNSEKYISECLSSIISQTYVNFEIIVWDNKSKDQTREVIQDLAINEKRLRLYTSDKHLPLGAARNQALNKCNGDWISFLDSDDVWDRNFLSDQMNALQGKEQEYFGYGHVTTFDNSELSIEHDAKRNLVLKHNILKNLLRGNFIFFSSLVISRPAMNYVRFFNNDFVQAEDYELLLRLAEKYNALQVGHVYYRNHATNTSKNQSKELYIETLQILEPYLSNFEGTVHYSLNLAKFATFSFKSQTVGDFWIVLERSKLNLLYLSLGLAYLLVSNLKNFKLIKYLKKKLSKILAFTRIRLRIH